MVNLNYCQVCGKWLGMDDYDGICTECDVPDEEEAMNPTPPLEADDNEDWYWNVEYEIGLFQPDSSEDMIILPQTEYDKLEAQLRAAEAQIDQLKAELAAAKQRRWMPVSEDTHVECRINGGHGNFLHVHEQDSIEVFDPNSEDMQFWVFLPDNIRLCRLAQEEGRTDAK